MADTIAPRTGAPAELSGLPDIASFTRERVERVMAISVAIAFAALGAQAFFVALGEEAADRAWQIVLLVIAFIPLVAMEIAFFIGRAVKVAGTLFVVAYFVVLACWPFATSATMTAITYQPWIYFLINVATVAAVIVMPLSVHLPVTIVAPLAYGLVRLIELDFVQGAWVPVAFDSLYALILGSVLLALGSTFRSAASTIDERRAHAVSSYAQAAAANASERERVAVAALMHDSVLAALLAAARAESARERDLAVSMAREALTRLANTDRDASEGSDEPVHAADIEADIRAMLDEVGAVAGMRTEIHAETPMVPGRVARALVLATGQAVSNAVQHADGVGLHITLEGVANPGGVLILIQDAGDGFDLDHVADDRLGIRASILARVVAFGGEAHVHSDADGTRVTLRWRSAE